MLGPLLPPSIQFFQGPASPRICSLHVPIGFGLNLRDFSLGINSLLLFLVATSFYFKLPCVIAKVISSERNCIAFSLLPLCCASLGSFLPVNDFCSREGGALILRRNLV